MQYCRGCGKEVHETAKSCPSCGAIIKGSTTESGKSRVTAALLAVFLGWLGIHKFYLGQIGQGVAYLLFFWTCIPAIIAYVEFVLLLCMSDEKFEAKYG